MLAPIFTKNRKIMFREISKIFVFALMIILQGCATRQPALKLSFKVDKELQKTLADLPEKLVLARERLEKSETYTYVHLKIKSSFSTGSETTSSLFLILQYDQTLYSSEETLKDLGRGAMLEIMDIFQDKKPYASYNVKFLQDPDGDQEDEKNFRSFAFTVDELINS